MATCVFCGATGKLTGEHVLGDWLSRTPLDHSPVPHGAGWLNRRGRDLGTRPPYQQKVKDVCAACNRGWMSRLEEIARRVLTPFILGEPGRLEREHKAAVAAWAQKTARTAMRATQKQLTYRADQDGLQINLDPPSLPTCPYCTRWKTR